MRILLTTLNAKFTHTNLALRYLRSFCRTDFPELQVREFNINQDLDLVTAEIARTQPDLVGFSCYIWNRHQTLAIISDLQRVLPQSTIVVGGPEVSYDGHQLLDDYPEVDYVVAGEGEKAFLELLHCLADGSCSEHRLGTIPNLIYRLGKTSRENPQQTLDLTTIPPVYFQHMDELPHRIVYYETSRGCPFKCSYCLSSRSGPVRFFPWDRCLAELAFLSRQGVEQIRFVDRTFNCDKKRAQKLIAFLSALDTSTRFQFEMAGDLIDAKTLDLLADAPPNRFQLEIGVQSTNQATLCRIGRTTDLPRLAANVRQIKRRTQVRVLLDLIAGLPHENFSRFGQSFDFVYELGPTTIHLGFLKLLKGSKLRAETAEFGCVFQNRPPYEVLKTDSISYEQLRQLKTIEDLVERFVNSHRFTHSLAYLLHRDAVTPFALLNAMATSWRELGYHLVSHSLFVLYEHLYAMVGEEDPVLRSMLRLDFRLYEAKRTTPVWMGGEDGRNLVSRLARNRDLCRRIPCLRGLSPREINRHVKVERFHYQVYPWNGGPIDHSPLVLLFYYATPASAAQVYPLPNAWACEIDDSSLVEKRNKPEECP